MNVCEACAGDLAVERSYEVRTATLSQLARRVGRPLHVCDACKRRLDGEESDEHEDAEARTLR